MAGLVTLLPREGDVPPWVVAIEYGRLVRVWNADGEALGERAHEADAGPVMATESFAGRVLVQGGATARGFDLGGALRFEVPLGDFRLSQAAGVRFAPGEPFALVVAAATDRDTARARLVIVTAGPRVVYDEIFEQLPRLLVARREDGAETLFVADSEGVRAVERRGPPRAPRSPAERPGGAEAVPR